MNSLCVLFFHCSLSSQLLESLESAQKIHFNICMTRSLTTGQNTDADKDYVTYFSY